MLMAKESLMESIDMFELKARGPQNKTEELRIERADAHRTAVVLEELVIALGRGEPERPRQPVREVDEHATFLDGN